MNIQEIEILIQVWASKKTKIKNVWLFGSRIRGNYRTDSDLDVAVELFKEPDPNYSRTIEGFETLSPELIEAMSCQDEWENELKGFLPYKIDLEFFRDDETPIMKKALSESSRLIYTSKNTVVE